MTNQNYIVVCQTRKQVATLYERLCDHLCDVKVYFRGVKAHRVIKLTSSDAIVTLLFVSEKGYAAEDIMRTFNGQKIDSNDVERWLDVHENYKTCKYLKK